MALLPMFPLGGVLLPSVYLPLHVFEPRYRQLVQVCLDGDQEFGVVLIERGSEVGGGDQRVHVGTVARIIEAAQMPDGRWALGAVGTRRIRVREWLPDDPYPRAEVDDWPEPELSEEATGALAASLAEVMPVLRRVLATRSELGEPTAPATIELTDDPVLASYQASAVAPIGPADQQRLLEQPDAAARVGELGRLLAEEAAFLTQRLALESEEHPGDDPGDGP
ncbi:MAG: LON peptidase substrate-binding domain-containing protein [Acidimicrobiales bacterium]